MKKKILILTEIYLKGGLDTFLHNLYIKKKNIEIYLMCNEDYPGIKDLKKKTKLISYLSINSNLFEKLNYLRQDIILKILLYFPLKCILLLFNYFILTFFYLIKYYFFFKKNKFDRLMVVNGGYPASLILRISLLSWRLSSRKKSILNIHNFSLPYRFPFGVFEYFLDFLIMKSVNKIILCSKSCLKNFIDKRNVFSNHKDVDFIYNGIENNNLKKVKKIKNSVGVFATLENRKGHLYLLDIINLIVKKNNKIKFFFFGDGENWSKNLIKKKIIKLKLEKNVMLQGHVKKNIKYMSKMELVAIPSIDFESFGYVGIEAMSCKVPIIANKIGGLEEILNNVPSAKLIKVGFQKTFAREIIKFFSQNQKKIDDKLSQSYERFKKNYTKNIMQKNYFKKII